MRICCIVRSLQSLNSQLSQERRHGWFKGGDNCPISPMENRQLRTLFLQEIRPFQARNLELVRTCLSLLSSFYVRVFQSIAIELSLKTCCWIGCVSPFHCRYLSIERNRYLYIHLFPEPSKVSKEHPPVARFIVRVSNTGSSRKFYISPGLSSSSDTFCLVGYLSNFNLVCCLYEMSFYKLYCKELPHHPPPLFFSRALSFLFFFLLLNIERLWL